MKNKKENKFKFFIEETFQIHSLNFKLISHTGSRSHVYC